MSDLAAFYAARLGEIAARHTATWWNECERCHEHAPCWAVLDAEAKQRIVERLAALDANRERLTDAALHLQWTVVKQVVEILAAPHNEHHQYDPEWRP